MPIILVAVSLTAAVWLAVLIGWLSASAPVIRAYRSQVAGSALVALIAVGPIVAQCLTPRPAGLGFIELNGGITATPPRMAVLVSQATAIGAVALAASLFLANRPRSRRGLVVGGSLGAGVLLSSLFGARIGLVRGAFYLPIVLIGLSAVHMTRVRILSLARISTQVYTYGSLAAALLVPSWAFHSAPGGIALPGLPGRLFGVGFHPNLLGFTAVLAIIVEAMPPRVRAANWHSAAALAVIALAGSRMAWVALIAVTLVWSLSNARRRAEGVAGLTVTVGLILVGSYLVIGAGTGTVANLHTRVPIWHQTIALWHSSPLFGIGPSLYRGAFASQAGVIAVDQAHNQILQTLAESGVVGLALLSVVLVTLFRAALSDWSGDSAAAMTVFVAFACLMFSESPLRVTGASHALYLDMLIVLLILRRSFVSHELQSLERADVLPALQARIALNAGSN